MKKDEKMKLLSDIDPKIEPYVKILMEEGIETYESCQGGEGHPFPEPTIKFHGERPDGFKALAIAQNHRLPVKSLRRAWSIEDGEPVGPKWELVFWEE